MFIFHTRDSGGGGLTRGGLSRSGCALHCSTSSCHGPEPPRGLLDPAEGAGMGEGSPRPGSVSSAAASGKRAKPLEPSSPLFLFLLRKLHLLHPSLKVFMGIK